jgi:hypothetical protein
MEQGQNGGRYNKYYLINNHIKYYLEEIELNIQESKFLLYKVLEQAVRDYTSINIRDYNNGQLIWDDARAFIFDEDYTIDWGDLVLSLDDICSLLEVDIDWFRDKAKERYSRVRRTYDGRRDRKRK